LKLLGSVQIVQAAESLVAELRSEGSFAAKSEESYEENSLSCKEERKEGVVFGREFSTT
jgi:hypothetical protein